MLGKKSIFKRKKSLIKLEFKLNGVAKNSQIIKEVTIKQVVEFLLSQSYLD